MGLFNKNRTTNDANAEQAVSSKKQSAKDDLSKVLDESVWESAFEDLKANEQFVTRRDGETKYVVFLIETAQFGGLANREAKKDESKGSIIEAIKTGRIKTYLPMDMLKEGLIIIIPDRNTVENMDEFNIFHNIDYVLCTIDTNGSVLTMTGSDGNEISFKFEPIRDAVRNGSDVESFFTGAVNDEFGMATSDDDDAIPEEDPLADTGVAAMPDERSAVEPIPSVESMQTEQASSVQPIQSDDSDAQFEQQGHGEEGEDISNLDLNTGADDFGDIGGSSEMLSNDISAADANGSSDIFEEGANSEQSYLDGDTGGYDEFEDVTSDIVNEFVTRKFFSNDLGLEVSTQSFDAQFLHKNEYIPFNENRGSGWLNEYLSNFSKDANTRMERMHSENLFRLRETYMRLIQAHCANIAKLLDTTNDTTQYGKIKAAIVAAHDDNISNIDRAVEDKAEQLKEAWESQLQKIGEEGRSRAVAEYVKDYGDKHNRDLAKLREVEREEIDNDYYAALRVMNEDRRAEATKLLDLAVNETLNKMSDAYAEIIQNEDAEYQRYHEEMLKFIDENRKDEKARIEALAEENRQVKRANEVRGEYIAKIKAMSAEYEMKRTVLQSDIDNMRREHEIEIRNLDNESNSKLMAERSRADSLQTQLDSLLQQYSELEDKKNKELEERVKLYKDDAALKDSQMQHMIQSGKKSNALTIGLCAALLIAGLGIGFVFGHGGIGGGNATLAAQQADVAPTSVTMEVNEAEQGTVAEAAPEV